MAGEVFGVAWGRVVGVVMNQFVHRVGSDASP